MKILLLCLIKADSEKYSLSINVFSTTEAKLGRLSHLGSAR